MLFLIPLFALSVAHPAPLTDCDVVSIEVSTDDGLNFQACPTGQSLNACNTLKFRVTTRGNVTDLSKICKCDTTTLTPILGSEMHSGDQWICSYSVASCGPCVWSYQVTPKCDGTSGQAVDCQFNLTKDGCFNRCCVECAPRYRFGLIRRLLGR